MIVKKGEDFKGKVVPLEEWKIKLQEDFPFMEQDLSDDGNIYRKWGFQCSGGWSRLLRDCCFNGPMKNRPSSTPEIVIYLDDRNMDKETKVALGWKHIYMGFGNHLVN